MALTLALSAASAPRAEANLFGAFRTRHQACCAPVVVRATPVVAHYAAPTVPVACNSCAAPVVAACPAPQPVAVAETCMQQRCYPVPVTTYQTKTRYQLVTSYQTRVEMQPVTTMTTSAYYDPCSCSYYNMAVPVTTMVRKETVVPTSHYVAQNYVEPVTVMTQQCRMEPVTQIRHYYPAGVAPAVAVPAPVVAAPAVAVPGVAAAPQPPPQQQLAAANPPAGAAPQVPAGPQAGQPGSQIQLPGSNEGMKPVPRDETGSDPKNYPPSGSNPAVPYRVIEDRHYDKDNKLLRENITREPLRLEDPAAAGESKSPTVPPSNKATGAGASSNFAAPKAVQPIPRGAKMASWMPGNSTRIVLGKPYSN
ncbi:MAG TPA: hypothetical protein VNC50_01220 [Planctomycetia bacterium]|nr:hypothetical protein [Planctomycetia bacterium]